MCDPNSLYTIDPAVAVPHGLPLIATVTGFVDAGEAVEQAARHLHGTLEVQTVVTFDADTLLDYRARRPVVSFVGEQLVDWRAPALTLDVVVDELGEPFLLLSGFEPDFRWQQFTAAVLELIERFAVASTTVVSAIPMPLPHTRPIRFAVRGNRPDLISAFSAWSPTAQTGSSALHLLQLRLQERHHPVTGFVLLVPHYLADTEYPAAGLAALEAMTAATGRIFPTETIRERDREIMARVDTQIAQNSELAQMLHALEERYDQFITTNGLHSPLTDREGEVPSADELAAELERFLAHRTRDEGEARS